MAIGLRHRLRAGQPLWRDQLLIRCAGVGAYGAFAGFVRMLCAWQQSRPALAAHPAMFAACFLAVIVFHVGSALTWIGPDLFRAGSDDGDMGKRHRADHAVKA